jgi:hypothetical protein
VKYSFLALILTVMQPLPTLPRQTVNEQAKQTHANAKVPNHRQNSPEPSASIIVMNNCANENDDTNATRNAATNLHPDSQKQSEPWSRSDKLILAYDILTGVLVFLALGTGIAVAWQAVKTAEATQAMRAGIALQEANFQQWIDVNKWRAASGKDDIEVAFDLVNSTDWPLTPLRTYIRIGNSESLRRHDVVLGPKQPYTIDNLFVAVVPEWKAEYISGRSPMLPALILITYRNCLKKEAQQELTGTIHFATLGSGPIFKLIDLPNLRVGEWYKKAREISQEPNSATTR